MENASENNDTHKEISMELVHRRWQLLQRDEPTKKRMRAGDQHNQKLINSSSNNSNARNSSSEDAKVLEEINLLILPDKFSIEFKSDSEAAILLLKY